MVPFNVRAVRPSRMDLSSVYLICFGVGLLFTLVTAAFAHDFQGGHEAPSAHAEAGINSGNMPGFAALSPTTIASFVTAFGGFGMILQGLDATRSPWMSAPLAAIGGFIVAAVVLFVFRAIFRATQSSSESHVAQLLGVSGTILTPIPEGGVGEIAYVHGGSRYTAPARTDDGRPIAAGTTVYIVRLAGSQFYVSAV